MILIIIGIAVRTDAETYTHNIAGFISQGFIYTDDNNYYTDTTKGSFQFNEIGININKRISPKMKAGIQLLSYTIGDVGKNDIEVDWGFADYSYNRYLNLRAGILKAPLGLYNETRDVDSSMLYIFLPSSVYQTNFRDTVLRLTGVGLYGELSTGIAGDFNYQFLSGKLDLDENSATAKSMYSTYKYEINVEDLNVKTDYIFNIKWYLPVEGLLFSWVYRDSEMNAISSYTYGNNQIKFEMKLPQIIYQTFSLKYETKSLILNYELFDLKTTYIHPYTAIINPSAQNKQTTKRMGWYADVQFIVTQMIQIGGYYSKIYGDIHDKKGLSDDFDPNFSAWQEDICFSIRMDMTDSWIFKTEIHKMNGTMALIKSDHVDTSGKLNQKEDWMLFAAKLSYLF